MLAKQSKVIKTPELVCCLKYLRKGITQLMPSFSKKPPLAPHICEYDISQLCIPHYPKQLSWTLLYYCLAPVAVKYFLLNEKKKKKSIIKIS